jgi:N-methylhydantoinase B
MGRGLQRLLDEYGLAVPASIFAEIIDRSEGAMRRVIRELPPGTYRHAITIDGFDSEVRLAIALKVADGAVSVDYTGSSPQSTRGLNSVPNYTFAYTAYALKCALAPLIPNNEGSYRPIRVQAPKGTILNPRFPAAVGSRGRTGHFLVFTVFGALAKAVPDRVQSDSGGSGMLFFGGTARNGRRFTHLFPMNGGQGAGPRKDGISCLAFPANCSSVPVEVVETLTPIRVLRKELLADSGGPGKFRGGCGIAIDLEVMRGLPVPELTLSIMAERTKHPAGGLCGGLPGSRQVNLHNHTRALHSKKQAVVQEGDRLSFRTPGGGGFGDPWTRDPGRVARDVHLGLVSPEAAREQYGVALLSDGSVDGTGTERLRADRHRAALTGA